MIKRNIIVSSANPGILIDFTSIPGIDKFNILENGRVIRVTIHGENEEVIDDLLDRIKIFPGVDSAKYEFTRIDAIVKLERKLGQTGLVITKASSIIHDDENSEYIELWVKRKGNEQKYKVTSAQTVELLPPTASAA